MEGKKYRKKGTGIRKETYKEKQKEKTKKKTKGGRKWTLALVVQT
jgi:hypothetical protein